MSTLKLVLEIGVEFIPVVGKPISAGLGMPLPFSHYLSAPPGAFPISYSPLMNPKLINLVRNRQYDCSNGSISLSQGRRP